MKYQEEDNSWNLHYLEKRVNSISISLVITEKLFYVGDEPITLISQALTREFRFSELQYVLGNPERPNSFNVLPMSKVLFLCELGRTMGK